MDIHGYPDIQWVWIWSNIHAHGYFYGWGKVRLVDLDLDLDLNLQYPSKSAQLSSLLCSLGTPNKARDHGDINMMKFFAPLANRWK
jgi:hypothetical protein